jgi:putative Holliday junction resolvase
MKLLGIDYGTKRIGLATGDTEGSFAFPLRTVPNDAGAVVAVLRAAKEEGADRLVIGMPVRLDGTTAAGETEMLIDRFVAELSEATSLPIDIEDERLTSVIAERRRRETDTKRRDFDIDAEAASILLEGYLERLRNADLS